jgi:hypothetical protein
MDLAEPWDAEVNLPPTVHRQERGPGGTSEIGVVSELICPASGPEAVQSVPSLTSYVGMAGVGPKAAELPVDDPRSGVFGYDRETPVEAIVDGLGATILAVETDSENGPWTAGGPSTVRDVDPSQVPCLGPGRRFGGLHVDGTNVLMADAEVRFLNDAIDAQVLESLVTIADPADHRGAEDAPPASSQTPALDR